MPVPKPEDGESDRDFMGRCMADPNMQKYPHEQRVAICLRQTEDGRKSLDLAMLDQSMLADDLDVALSTKQHREPTGQFAFGGKTSARREADKTDHVAHAVRSSARSAGQVVADINAHATAPEGLTVDAQPSESSGTEPGQVRAVQAGGSDVPDLHIVSHEDTSSAQAMRAAHAALADAGYDHVAHYAHDEGGPLHTNYYESGDVGVALTHDVSSSAGVGAKIKVNGRAYDAGKHSMTEPSTVNRSMSDVPDCPECGKSDEVEATPRGRSEFHCGRCQVSFARPKKSMEPTDKGAADQPRGWNGRWTSSGGLGPVSTAGKGKGPKWDEKSPPKETVAALVKSKLDAHVAFRTEATAFHEPEVVRERLRATGWDHVHTHMEEATGPGTAKGMIKTMDVFHKGDHDVVVHDFQNPGDDSPNEITKVTMHPHKTRRR